MKKKLLGRKILSVMKLEGENWRLEGGPVAHVPISGKKIVQSSIKKINPSALCNKTKS